MKTIAAERISILFDNAEKRTKENPALASRYVKTLRRLSSHYKIGLPKAYKNRICTNCNTILIPGLNSTVRISSSNRYIIYKCDKCKKERHIHY